VHYRPLAAAARRPALTGGPGMGTLPTTMEEPFNTQTEAAEVLHHFVVMI